jgi:purine-nucleoside phosphorylase
MSTVPEAIVAKHGGLRTFGISLITDMVSLTYDETRATTHEEVLEVGQRRAADLQKIVTTMVGQMDASL